MRRKEKETQKLEMVSPLKPCRSHEGSDEDGDKGGE